ncbi:MAG: S1/P1 nuclease [Alistipes sp.]|jgi:hypothetical protein|nr:S1/P1 nuclease [Alistipes sp.]
MKIKHFLGAIFLFAALVNTLPSFGWGGKGHNAIAHIAQKHLSKRAEREITRLLDGRSMAYWSSWADGLRDDNRYDFLSTWHYANADEGYTYAISPKQPEGDVYTAVTTSIEQLQAPGTSDSLKSMYLKFLIHFVGDLHCPMHAGHASDRGGNGFAVDFRGSRSNLHRLWDSQIVDAAQPWSALEWAVNTDYRAISRREFRERAAGSPLEWMEQTVVLSHMLYAETPQDESLSWGYINRFSPIVEQKFTEAGYRLAGLLNEIFK